LEAIIGWTTLSAATPVVSWWATAVAFECLGELFRLVLIDAAVRVGVRFDDTLHSFRQFVFAHLPIAVLVQTHELIGEIVTGRPTRTSASAGSSVEALAWTACLAGAYRARSTATTTRLARTCAARSVVTTTELRTHFVMTQFAVAVPVKLLQCRRGVCDLVSRKLAVAVCIKGIHHGMRRGTEIAFMFTSLGSTKRILSVAGRLCRGPRRIRNRAIGN
jgi:hypothetical protein